jgi:hypothetical protein
MSWNSPGFAVFYSVAEKLVEVSLYSQYVQDLNDKPSSIQLDVCLLLLDVQNSQLPPVSLRGAQVTIIAHAPLIS